MPCTSNNESKRKRHCLFCGEKCDIAKDPKNPSRWRPTYVCRQGDRYANKNLKKAALELCDTIKNLHV